MHKNHFDLPSVFQFIETVTQSQELTEKDQTSSWPHENCSS